MIKDFHLQRETVVILPFLFPFSIFKPPLYCCTPSCGKDPTPLLTPSWGPGAYCCAPVSYSELAGSSWSQTTHLHSDPVSRTRASLFYKP